MINYIRFDFNKYSDSASSYTITMLCTSVDLTQINRISWNWLYVTDYNCLSNLLPNPGKCAYFTEPFVIFVSPISWLLLATSEMTTILTTITQQHRIFGVRCTRFADQTFNVSCSLAFFCDRWCVQVLLQVPGCLYTILLNSSLNTLQTVYESNIRVRGFP